MTYLTLVYYIVVDQSRVSSATPLSGLAVKVWNLLMLCVGIPGDANSVSASSPKSCIYLSL